jgi:hypothetical protein
LPIEASLGATAYPGSPLLRRGRLTSTLPANLPGVYGEKNIREDDM